LARRNPRAKYEFRVLRQPLLWARESSLLRAAPPVPTSCSTTRRSKKHGGTIDVMSRPGRTDLRHSSSRCGARARPGRTLCERCGRAL